MLNWSECPAVESVPGRLSGAWVFRGTRTPVQPIFESLELGESILDLTNTFDVTEEQIKAVLAFAAKSLDKIPAYVGSI